MVKENVGTVGINILLPLDDDIIEISASVI